ncbi:MAG: hypothetical protein JJT90_02735 [Ectothiorhodospiraceae bacterium]|nr:hypothetical protein [Ectothiorhodospiraceae bacterium]
MSTDTEALPPKPTPPEPDECCGGGCVPCVYDLYEDALERWKERVRSIREAEEGQPKPARDAGRRMGDNTETAETKRNRLNKGHQTTQNG